HAFIAQMGEHGARDVLKIRIDDQTYVADAAAPRVTEQRKGGDGDAVVVGEEVDGIDLIPRLLDEIDTRLRGIAIVVENAKDIGVRVCGNGYSEEQSGEPHAGALCMR